MTYSTTMFKVATSNGLGGDTFTRNVTDGRTHGQTDGRTDGQTDRQTDRRTDGRTDGRRTDFDMKLIYPFFLKKKAGIKSNYPHVLLKKRRGYCYRLRPSVCPLCYLLLNHWTKFNQIWCVKYSHEWGAQRKLFLGPASWGPGEESKVKYHLISITKSISKIFIPNFVCVLTIERYKTYQMGFLFCHRGHTLGVGLGGT